MMTNSKTLLKMKDKRPIPNSIHKKMLNVTTKPREKTKTKKQLSYIKQAKKVY
jgi:hypothetical protein